MSLSNLQNSTFTIINQIPQSISSAKKRAWFKHTLRKCGKQNGIYDRTGGTMLYKTNTFTAYIGDWERYMPPSWLNTGYYTLPDKDKANYFTVNVGDLIVFDDIDDSVPTTLQEFQALVAKYGDNGGTVTGFQEYINYKPNGEPWRTNHIEAVKG